MFRKNGIDLKMDELVRIFTIVDEDRSGALTLDEFQLYTYDQKAQEKFKEQINNIKKRIQVQKLKQKSKSSLYLPSDFNSLFSHLYYKTKHQQIR